MQTTKLVDSEEEEEEEKRAKKGPGRKPSRGKKPGGAKKKGKVRLERTTRMLVLEHEQKRQDRTVSLCSHESLRLFALAFRKRGFGRPTHGAHYSSSSQNGPCLACR